MMVSFCTMRLLFAHLKKLAEEKKESTIVIDNIDTNNKNNGKEPSEVNLDGEH